MIDFTLGMRRQVASLRQIVETVHDKLLTRFGLARERPHTLAGLRARLEATVTRHHFCCWLNQHLGRPLVTFADLVDWEGRPHISHQTFEGMVAVGR